MNTDYAARVRQIDRSGTYHLIVIPLLVALAVTALIPGIATPIFGLFLPHSDHAIVTAASTAAMWVSLIGGGYLMIAISKLSWERLGFTQRQPLRDTLTGIILGLGLLVLVAFLIRILGGTTWHWAFNSQAIAPIVTAAFFFAAQGTWEELVYRGYLMPYFSKKWGDAASITITSLLFTAGHALNPGLTALPIINLIIFGFVFALLYYRTGSLWLTGAAHAAWNFSQGFVYGAEVSGNITQGTFIRSIARPGHDIISGGAFGFEGSIITSIAGLVIILILSVGWSRLRRT